MENHTNEKSFDPECADGCAADPRMTARFHAAINAISGKWKIEVLCILMDGVMRFGDLRRALPGITQHMLTAQLRDLEADGLITRTACAQIPARVDYALTEAAYGLLPAFRALRDWSAQHGDKLISDLEKRPVPSG